MPHGRQRSGEGLGDALAALLQGKVQLGGRWTVRRTLASQLAELGLRPDDIDYVALSHLHADHSGNIGLFPTATWLLPAEELRPSAIAAATASGTTAAARRAPPRVD
ncbi:MBL fold metallo-hydrolase [Corticibacterium sp. UT-5YL-CI-8]|nr:MBL fold metallo-hydrolase [Tianweitania sp. UT-5YL-CI-8]